MLQLNVKPGDRLIKGYYEALGEFGHQHVDHEMPFAAPSRTCYPFTPRNWTGR
jgi:hypothetical protein